MIEYSGGVAVAGTPVPSQQFQALADHAPVVLGCDSLAICRLVPDGQGYLMILRCSKSWNR